MPWGRLPACRGQRQAGSLPHGPLGLGGGAANVRLAEAEAVVVVVLPDEEQAERLAAVLLHLDRAGPGARVEVLPPQGVHVAHVEVA